MQDFCCGRRPSVYKTKSKQVHVSLYGSFIKVYNTFLFDFGVSFVEKVWIIKDWPFTFQTIRSNCLYLSIFRCLLSRLLLQSDRKLTLAQLALNLKSFKFWWDTFQVLTDIYITHDETMLHWMTLFSVNLSYLLRLFMV